MEIIRTAYGVPPHPGSGPQGVRPRPRLGAARRGLRPPSGPQSPPHPGHRGPRVFGRDSIEIDFLGPARPPGLRRSAVPPADQATRDVYEGFAAGVNRFVTLHRDQFAPDFPADFSGYDVAAQDVAGPIRPGRAVRAPADGPRSRPGAPGTPAKRRSPIPTKAPTPGPWRPRAPGRSGRSCCVTRTSPGTPDTTRRTPPCRACSTSTATSGSAGPSA